MIKFFRQIRQNLLSDGKTGKYFKYAIGEIILVVIGILIALQINNWNEHLKGKKSAETQLRQLSQNVSGDLILLNSLKTIVTGTLRSCHKLSEQFQLIEPFDSLTTSYIIDNIFERNFYGNTSAFTKLNQSDEFSILPKTLQNDITHYYNLLNRVKEREEISNTFIKKDYEPYYFDNYSIYHRKASNQHSIITQYYKNDKRKPVALNIDKITNDHKMATLIYARYYQLKNQQKTYQEAIEKAEQVQKSINDYLKLNE
ncbi:Hypothetical protein I595_1367 [Croceitalea dokdonensis DOKDO 023]|uniref:Uncharacterized protein n=1 Tax=Croceitalea dokdonensis DOKDO 023 TaxID=1300341 RepID=A0A0N8H4B9_9FLAO|nr:DUF6090 family protein [Croceitalea dokdonensis]KPM32940.1 Hypothetical protein I595_1367 [Croceitalea dokdonensis DOKDO 023]